MTKEPKDGGLDCYDCGAVTTLYMVLNPVWAVAFPDYHEVKAALLKRHPNREAKDRVKAHIALCFDCLEKRLGRRLRLSDFNLELPANHGIRLGVELVARHLEAALETER